MASNDIRERHERSESAAETLMDVFLFRNDICGAQRYNRPIFTLCLVGTETAKQCAVVIRLIRKTISITMTTCGEQ